MLKKAGLATVIFSVVGMLAGSAAMAQTQDTQQQQPAAKDQAAQNQTPAATPSLYYEVVQAKGAADVAALDADPMLKEGWTRLKVGDRLVAGQQVRTSLRGALRVTAVPSDPPTVMLIERSTLIAITELAHTGDTAKSRISLGYGAIKAGVSEGTTRSDMEIEAPVATLSKRGTDIFRFEYRNNRFKMELSAQGRGLVEAIQTRAGEFGGRNRIKSRFLTPGQWISHQMLRAIDEVSFDRSVNIGDVFGLQDMEKLLAQSSGLQFLSLNGNNLAVALDPQNTGPEGIGFGTIGSPSGLFPSTPTETSLPYGNFGIGQGGIPSIFGKAKDVDAARRSHRGFRDRINTVRAVRNMIRRHR